MKVKISMVCIAPTKSVMFDSPATLALSNNVVSKKRLIGIMNFINSNSEAAFLSRGSNVASTERDIRDTKKAQVLLPLLSDIVDVKELLRQFKNGGVEFTEFELNEFIVDLANEKATKPKMWRPRDGETISASGLFDRYKAGFEISATRAKDEAFYKSLVFAGLNGVPVAKGIAAATKLLKSAIVERVTTSGADIKLDAIKFANQIRAERSKLKAVYDKFIGQTLTNADFDIIIKATDEIYLENDATYNMFTEMKQIRYEGIRGKTKETSIVHGNYDGSNVIVSKKLPQGISAIIKYAGSATSIFALRKKMNVDKANGVDAYGVSLEFDEGTGVWLPYMNTIITTDTQTYPTQDKIGFDELILEMNTSQTTSGNADNSDGLEDGNVGNIATIAEIDALTEPEADGFAELQGIDLTGAGDLAAKIAAIKSALGIS